MAQKVSIQLVDDIDGSDAGETISFGLDGASYEIDLNDANAAALREALSPYVGHARKLSAAPRRARRGSGASTAASGGPSAKEIREWARDNGWEVPERGRVSSEVREAYDAAH
ncbi:histone-like nucleoid-structuring protein Lsr2 [Nocardioides pacificus]